MTTNLIVVGAGGFGRETLDVVEAIGLTEPGRIRLLGVVDDAPTDQNVGLLTARGIPLLGKLDVLMTQPQEVRYLIGIGSPPVRAAVAERLDKSQRDAFIAIHPAATVGSMSRIGPGSVICAGAQISTNVTLGRHTHVNAGSLIGHDTRLQDWVSINPGAVVSGDVHIGPRTLVGANATILQGLSLARDVVVGASACVVRDVPSGVTVKGVPAR
ncbi:acetyltransferase [Frigoribacterium sp. 9N]|uniref:acetyltransferase n=1 Tax=Frigoribacterium sp. 9N TaxID=2653144 RepID=UPI00135998E9|nr:acetyltransferase [Frigoribacterium sp. 9N]